MLKNFQWIAFGTLFICALRLSALAAPAVTQTPPPQPQSSIQVDPSLQPAPGEESEEVSNVFRDMGVVQRKAVDRVSRLSFATYFSMDFSDGPYTLYGVNTDLSYGISDFLEIGVNYVPLFINNPRSIVTKVDSLTLANGNQASISSALAHQQYGLEVLWAPLYGKDSVGIRNVLRSDTFLKFGAGIIQYDQGSGNRFQLGIGKTFFIGKSAGLRLTVSGVYLQSIVDGLESYRSIMMTETGLVIYL